MRVELVAGALLLLAVGAMTSVAPSKTAWEAHERLGWRKQATVGDVDLVLRVAPAQIGDNEFAVDVTDKRPGAQDAPSKVLLNFDMPGWTWASCKPRRSRLCLQRYTARGSFTSMGGRWQIEVVLRRAGFDDVRHTFRAGYRALGAGGSCDCHEVRLCEDVMPVAETTSCDCRLMMTE